MFTQIYRANVKTNTDVNPGTLQSSTHKNVPFFKNKQSPSHGTNVSYSKFLLMLTVLDRIICKKTHKIGKIYMQISRVFT